MVELRPLKGYSKFEKFFKTTQRIKKFGKNIYNSIKYKKCVKKISDL